MSGTPSTPTENSAIRDVRRVTSPPGATWPNRLYAMTGQSAGSRDDQSVPIYCLPTFVRYLDEAGVPWRWYSYDPGTLRAVDPEYRLSHHGNFGYVDERKLSVDETELGSVNYADLASSAARRIASSGIDCPNEIVAVFTGSPHSAQSGAPPVLSKCSFTHARS